MRRLCQLIVPQRDMPVLGWVRSRFSTGLALHSTSTCICMPAWPTGCSRGPPMVAGWRFTQLGLWP